MRGRQLRPEPTDHRVCKFEPIQGSSEWKIIQEIFYFKQPLTLEYEGQKLVDDPNVKQPWSPQEDTLLSEIVQ